MDSEVYGAELVEKLLQLWSQGIISSEDVDTLYILSIDWPYQVKIEYLDTTSSDSTLWW